MLNNKKNDDIIIKYCRLQTFSAKPNLPFKQKP